MLFNYKYGGTSKVTGTASKVGLSFAPDTLREPTFFVGKLAKHLPFREAMSALHDIVVADLRFQPKEREEYKAWAAQQEEVWLAEYVAKSEENKALIHDTKTLLEQVRNEKSKVMAPFYKARKAYYDYLYKKDRDAWFVLDPVITVNPDELFFECFSQDESSYGKLGCNYNVFKKIDAFECGTTNIDYSAALYNEFQKIRTYKETEFKVDPSGFEVQTTGEEDYKEVKIDLPDSWVRGFLQVSSAMTLNAVTFDLHPLDINNFLFVLKRQKEKLGPRYVRFKLTPGAPIEVIFEPWKHIVKCNRSIFKGDKSYDIKIWGRRRLFVLERLIPIAKKFTVTLLGNGMPSFYVADLGDMNFTLGLSGWTANDWSKMGNFDLMAPRNPVGLDTIAKVWDALKAVWVATPSDLSIQTTLEKGDVMAALNILVQNGKVVYDINNKVYRRRELSREELPLEKLRFANEREEQANLLVQQKKVRISDKVTDVSLRFYAGKVKAERQTYEAKLWIDEDDKLIKATCTCNFFKQNKMRKGPCEHQLAVRIASRENK